MGAATKGRSTGKSGTARKSSKGASSESKGPGTSRGAPRTDAPDAAPAEGTREADRGQPAQVGDAIVEPATSSQQAAEQRQAVDRPAVVGGEATPKQADEAKAMALPEVPPSPATNPGLEQHAMETARLRAHLVGEQARLTSDVGQGTAEAGQAQVRTFARLQQAKAPEPENVIEHTEVAIPVGGRELVFRQTFGGHVEVLWNDPARINAMRGGGPEGAIAVLTPDQWAALDKISGDGGSAPKAQSAADQRKGAKAEGGDPGPAALTPVFAR